MLGSKRNPLFFALNIFEDFVILCERINRVVGTGRHLLDLFKAHVVPLFTFSGVPIQFIVLLAHRIECPIARGDVVGDWPGQELFRPVFPVE